MVQALQELAAGVELAKKGFSVTIFEKEEKVGGLLTYGIPGFRLPRDLPNKINEKLEKLNIKIETNKELGKNITFEELKKNNFKAVFLGLGMTVPSKYRLHNETSDDICDSTYFLREYNSKRIVENLDKVVIIGGGNVACDSARAAIRMGAKDVKILYRRNQEKMPAREIEVNHAVEEGAKLEFNTKVLSAEIEDGRLKSLKCIKTICENNEIKDIPNSEFLVEATKVIFAIGYKTDKSLIEKLGIDINDRGMIIVDESNMTNIEGIFAGGDVSQAKATVCNAILEGKKAAEGIEKYIKKENA